MGISLQTFWFNGLDFPKGQLFFEASKPILFLVAIAGMQFLPIIVQSMR